jgi:hypothetical protein
MKLSSLIVAVSVCVGSVQAAVEMELSDSYLSGYRLDKPPEDAVFLWDRYLDAVTNRAMRGFDRVRPIFAMRQMVFDEENGSERINDTAFSTLNRIFSHGGTMLLRESQPYLTLKQKAEGWGEFIDNSVRDTLENIGEIFHDDMLSRNPATEPHDLMLDPEGPSPARLTVWEADTSYGIGIKSGGPSLFVRGKIRYHRRHMAYYDLRANLDSFDEVKIQNSIMIPITKRMQVSTGLTWLPLESELRYAIRGHYKFTKRWNGVASVGVGRGVTQYFLGTVCNW